MTASLERIMTSAAIRQLLPEALDGDASPETAQRLTDLLASLAGGDMELACRAVENFYKKVFSPDGTEEAVATEMLTAFLTGRIDVVRINPKAELVWCASRSEKEAGE
jgi:predicted metal-dependent hydrolase